MVKSEIFKAMAPIDDYLWSRRFLRRIFKLCGQDILAEKFRPDLYTAFTFLLWVFVTVSLAWTTFDANYDASVQYIAASFGFGAVQVILTSDSEMQKFRSETEHL